MTKKIIQIVPNFQPVIDGVGDYALSLARALRANFDIHTHFLIGNPGWEGPSHIEDFPTQKIGRRFSEVLTMALTALFNQISPNDLSAGHLTVLLQLSAYGYAKRGCPFWLIEGLKCWKKKDPHARLITIFHELYAFGPPWASSFWLSPIQRMLAKKILKVSDYALTNRQHYAKILKGWELIKQRDIPVLPVFSNIGEPKNIPALDSRPRRMVIFGKDRRKIYVELAATLVQACRYLNITEIYDIGPLTGLNLSKIQEILITEKGELPAQEISQLMLNAYAGFFIYPTNCLAKSTIFAAYCAHGLLPVTGKFCGNEDGLFSGEHYYVINSMNKTLNAGKLQLIATNAYNWYQKHNLFIQTRIFADIIS